MTQTSAPFRLVFMGTPDFAATALAALHNAGHTIVAVYSQPPRPAGRGHHLKKSAVHELAEKLNCPVHTPNTLRNEQEQEILKNYAPDAIVVAAYGLILPQAVLDIPPQGCLNIHGSLLPRWRGAAPIQRAILEGDKETGITIMKMEAGLDTGPMLMKRAVPITAQTTTSALHDTLAHLGGELILEALDKLSNQTIAHIKQDDKQATYAAKLNKSESLIDWRNDAEQIDRQIRAFTPWPGAYFILNAETREQIKVLSAQYMPEATQNAPGTLIDQDFTIACSNGALRLETIQRPGKAPTDAASALRGLRLPNGFKFPSLDIPQ